MSPLLISFVLLSAFLHHAKGHSGVPYECPEVNLGTCSCLNAYGRVHVQCPHLSNRQQLIDTFRKMAGYGISELKIFKSNITHIPRDLFKDSPVSRITIIDSRMIYLFDRELEKNADKLTEIVLDHVDFGGGLDWNVLDNLVSLKILKVSGSNVENVPYGASELELPLETLLLEDNYIEYIYDSAFQNLKDLTNLKLSKNYLERFTRSMLPLPESGIQFLDLSFNKLKSLPADAFEGMPELHSLLLSGNQFAVLEKSYMKNIFSSLFYLDVASNPLVCSCEMTWVLSGTKPFHLFGECSRTSTDASTKRYLKELTNEDFGQCSETDLTQK